MTLFSQAGDLLKQMTGAGSSQAEGQHFDQLAQGAPQSSVAAGLSDAFRSGDTPPFSQMASQMFQHANPEQRSSILGGLLGAVAPAALAHFTSSNPNSSLAGVVQGGANSVTPEQAAQVQPADVQQLVSHAESHDPSIVDRVSQLYAAHPTLIKTLGTAALAITAQRLAQAHGER